MPSFFSYVEQFRENVLYSFLSFYTLSLGHLWTKLVIYFQCKFKICHRIPYNFIQAVHDVTGLMCHAVKMWKLTVSVCVDISRLVFLTLLDTNTRVLILFSTDMEERAAATITP
jgi:hypothetical protein